jgi:hypothetical protein
MLGLGRMSVKLAESDRPIVGRVIATMLESSMISDETSDVVSSTENGECAAWRVPAIAELMAGLPFGRWELMAIGREPAGPKRAQNAGCSRMRLPRKQ